MSSRGFVFFFSLACVLVCVCVSSTSSTTFRSLSFGYLNHIFIYLPLFLFGILVSSSESMRRAFNVQPTYMTTLSCHSLFVQFVCSIKSKLPSSAHIMWRSGWQWELWARQNKKKKLFPLRATDPWLGIVSNEINDDEMKEDTSTDTILLIIIIVMRFLASIHMLINYQIIKYLINGRKKKPYLLNWHLLLVIPIRKECPPFAFMMMPYLWMHENVCYFYY